MPINSELLLVAILTVFFNVTSTAIWGKVLYRPALKADIRKPRRRSF